jgi:hypothetical protein
MPQHETLSVEEQDILLWVAESEVDGLGPTSVILADAPAFQWASTVIERLVERGLLARDFMGTFEHRPDLHGLAARLTGQGAEMVADLWVHRLRDAIPSDRTTSA